MRLLTSSSLLLMLLVLVRSQGNSSNTTVTEQELLIEPKLDSSNNPPLSIVGDEGNLQVMNKKNEHLVTAIDFDTSLELQQLTFFSRPDQDRFQMELDILVKDQISLTEDVCAFSIIYVNETQQVECLESFHVILKRPNAVLRINRKIIKSAVVLTYRLVSFKKFNVHVPIF